MKILYIAEASTLESSGANHSLLALVKLHKELFNVTPLVLVPSRGGLTDALEREGIHVVYSWSFGWIYIPPKKAGGRLTDYLKPPVKLLLNPVFVRRCLAAVKKYSFDLVYSNSSSVCVGAYIAKKLGKPHVWHIREFGDKDQGAKYLMPRSFVKRRYERASKIIAISDAVKNEFRKKFGDLDVVRIYNGINYRAEPKNLFNEKAALEFCCSSYIASHKNQLEILKAAKILRDKGVSDFKVNLVGSSNPLYAEEIDGFIRANGLEGTVKLWGFQPDIHRVLPGMDVGIMSSISEGFGRVTVEYMLHSMPVIGTNSGGTPELIKGESGFLYEPGNVKALAGFMEKFIKDRTLLKDMGVSACRYASEHFTAEQNAGKIYQLFETCL